MATRKTAAKTPAKSPAAKAVKTAVKAEGKPAVSTAKRTTAAARTPAAVVPAKPAAGTPSPGGPPTKSSKPIEPPVGEARYRWIAQAAYLRAEKRGFAPGGEVDDWLAAEAEFVAAHRIG